MSSMENFPLDSTKTFLFSYAVSTIFAIYSINEILSIAVILILLSIFSIFFLFEFFKIIEGKQAAVSLATFRSSVISYIVKNRSYLKKLD